MTHEIVGIETLVGKDVLAHPAIRSIAPQMNPTRKTAHSRQPQRTQFPFPTQPIVATIRANVRAIQASEGQGSTEPAINEEQFHIMLRWLKLYTRRL